MKIIIDPGHGGKDHGGGSNNHWLEKDMNLKISLYQYERLKKLGLDVELTRDKDSYLDKYERVEKVKESKADLCISNHINNIENPDVNGVEIIHSIYNNGVLAKHIMNELVNVGANKRRIFTKRYPNDNTKDYYYMNRLTGNVTTLIIEYGFASNKEDTKKIFQYWEEYAEAVIRSLCNYYNINYNRGGCNGKCNRRLR
ncbi:MAG: N-acetylmuramoyl-L-alanine amidase [Firmicutes bacterium]|nr:N-acetylmuramoyl-L-alanine amidase [Bacillota bacterium]